MSTPNNGHLMYVSARAREFGSNQVIELAHTEGTVSMGRAENGTIVILIEPIRPTRKPRRRGRRYRPPIKTTPPPIEFRRITPPSCCWLELTCLRLPQPNPLKRE